MSPAWKSELLSSVQRRAPATCRLMASREALAGSQNILGGSHLVAWLCAVSRCGWIETELQGWLSHAASTLS